MITHGDIETVLGDVNGSTLMEHIAEFARWTKHAGTPGELESLRYVEREMRSYGYETSIIQHDAYISLPGEARIDCAGQTLRCITHSFLRPSPPGGLTSKLVYVGEGTAQDYADREVAGCIVLVDGIANPAASVQASRHGAIAQIHVSLHEYVHEMCISPVWGSPGDDQLADLPATVVVTVALADGERLKRLLREGSDPEVTVVADVDTGWRKTPILVADLAAQEGNGDFILFTGHHDTWYYGVMDNGGANATMLEVSRICASRRAEWRRGLRVIYWSGHSQGRYSSSAWYADHHWEELHDRALVHVNVDSTGGKGNTVVVDTTASAELWALAAESLASQAGQPFSRRRMDRAGDQSFWGMGVPSIYGNMSEQPADSSGTNASAAVFGDEERAGAGTGWWWHTPYDTADKIEEGILVRDTRIYLHTVWRLLTDPVLPLDFETYAEVLIARLEDLQRQAGDRLDLSVLIERAELLREKLRDPESWDEADPAAVKWMNRTLKALSRALVPLEYTNGDRFSHDPALAQPSIPALADVPLLAALDPDSDAYKFLYSRLVRERNRVAATLRDALKTLDRSLPFP